MPVQIRPRGRFLENPMKEQLARLARRLRSAAVECHHRGMRPASEWLDDFAIEAERILAQVRLREQVDLAWRNRRRRFTSAELQSEAHVLHLNGRCDPQTCPFHLFNDNAAGPCMAGGHEGVPMRITGPDYTDESLIAPWDPARTQKRPNSLRDDPNRDDTRDDYDEPKAPAEEDKP